MTKFTKMYVCVWNVLNVKDEPTSRNIAFGTTLTL